MPYKIRIKWKRDRKPRHHDRDHRHQFDENVERRTRRILEGIADRIAHDRGPVAVGTLAAEVPLLDHLLGIVPGAPGIGHEDRQHETGTQSADQKAHYARHPEYQSDNDRSGDGQQARKQHLTLRTAGRNGDAARVVGRSSPVRMPLISRNWRRTSSTMLCAARPRRSSSARRRGTTSSRR